MQLNLSFQPFTPKSCTEAIWCREGDKRISFFSIVSSFCFDKVYAFNPERNWGRLYGHEFQSVFFDKDQVWSIDLRWGKRQY